MEVAVSSVVPTVTVTATPPSLPVSPLISKPAAFSAMLTVLSPAMGSRLRTRAGDWAVAVIWLDQLPRIKRNAPTA